MKEIIFILILALHMLINNCYIVLPFRIGDVFYFDNEEIDLDYFIRNWSNNLLIADLFVGSHPQIIKTLLNARNFPFYIFDVNINFEDSEKIPEQYDPNNSDTFLIIAKEESTEINKIIASESFHLLKNEGEISEIFTKDGIDINKIKEFKKIKFVYQEYKVKDLPLIAFIGFQVKNTIENYKDINFLEELFDLNYIDMPKWSIHFSQKEKSEGYLVIGSLPHIYDPSNYFEEDLISYKIDNSTKGDWKLNIENFYSTSNEKDIDSYLYIPFIDSFILDMNAYLIQAPIQLFDFVKNAYFLPLFYENICSYKDLTQIGFKFIFCDKNRFNNNIKRSFPALYFHVKEYNYTFKIDYKDLFKEKSGLIIFAILFDETIHNSMRLGFMFMKKYKFTFDFANNEIGFYKTGDRQKKIIIYKAKKFFNTRNIIILAIVILILIAFIIIMKFKNKKKKREVIDYNSAYRNVDNFRENNISQSYELTNES